MDIKVNITGETFYRIPNDVAAVLISCGLVEQVVPLPPKPKETFPEWSVVHPPGGIADSWCIRRCAGGIITYFSGPTAQAANGFKTMLWDGAAGKHILQGPEPPAEIIEKLARLRNEDFEADRQTLKAAERRRNTLPGK